MRKVRKDAYFVVYGHTNRRSQELMARLRYVIFALINLLSTSDYSTESLRVVDEGVAKRRNCFPVMPSATSSRPPSLIG